MTLDDFLTIVANDAATELPVDWLHHALSDIHLARGVNGVDILKMAVAGRIARDHQKVGVDVYEVEDNGVWFGAGPIFVTVGNSQVRAVAVVAGGAKRILPAGTAIEWLMMHGASEKVAIEIVNRAETRKVNE
jgi:hypothetical protein